MAFNIEESFEVEASVEDAWVFFSDPRRVVVCLPGAEVTGMIDDRSYEGRVRVKVGPVTAKYNGVVRLEEEDAGAHVVRLQGEGKETGGSGSARMSMTGRLTALGEQRTRIEVEAAIDVAGKLARFGRAVMEDISRQLFREFATNTQERLARPEPADGPSGDAPSGDAPSGDAPSGNAPSGRAPNVRRGSDGEKPPSSRSRREAAGTPAAQDQAAQDQVAQDRAEKHHAEKNQAAQDRAAQPLRLPGLLFRAIVARLKRWIRG